MPSRFQRGKRNAQTQGIHSGAPDRQVAKSSNAETPGHCLPTSPTRKPFHMAELQLCSKHPTVRFAGPPRLHASARAQPDTETTEPSWGA